MGESGEADFRLEGTNGVILVGMNGKRSQLCVRWECDHETGNISVTVMRARNLQKVDRLGLCDSQVCLTAFKF